MVNPPQPKRCHQCGRVGTRQFVPYPNHTFDFTYEGQTTVVECGQWGWECTDKNACRGRWPKRSMEDCW